MTPAQVKAAIQVMDDAAKEAAAHLEEEKSIDWTSTMCVALASDVRVYRRCARILTEALAASEAEDAAKAARRGCEKCGGIMAHAPTCRRYAMR